MEESRQSQDKRPLRILVVARWPLGGIRTYMKYVYGCFPERYQLTFLVSSTNENDALKRDAETLGACLVICPGERGIKDLMREIFRGLSNQQYDLIQSQGFISAVAVYPINLLFKIPHILTVHGILEDKYFKGTLARAKRTILGHVICRVDALYAVSNDILAHLFENIPKLSSARCRKVVIPNGIDVRNFDGPNEMEGFLRKRLGIAESVYLFGFIGRFMQQKGFKYLINAVEIIDKRGAPVDYKIIAVGTGDYLDYYKKVIKERSLTERFQFIPFQSQIGEIYQGLNAVVMPSLWEADPLVPMESLCLGVPLIASDCIGLREKVAGTPTVVFERGNSEALAEAMFSFMKNPVNDIFKSFIPIARQRYDVAHTAQALQNLIEETVYETRGGQNNKYSEIQRH